MNKNPLFYSNMKKKNTSIREEREQKDSFGWTYHQSFQISHKLQDATRKPEALHLPRPSS